MSEGLSQENLDRLVRELLEDFELPESRIHRYTELGLPKDTATFIAFDTNVYTFFNYLLEEDCSPKVAALWLTGELSAETKDQGREFHSAFINEEGEVELLVDPPKLAELIKAVEAKRITHAAGKEVLKEMVASGKRADVVIKEKDLETVTDSGQIQDFIDKAIADNPKAVEELRSGNNKAIGALIGSVMSQSKGRADGGEVSKLLREALL